MSAQLRDQLYLSESDKETTFKYDKDLPSLPLPTLDDTLRRYLESVRHLVDKDQWEETRQKVQQFKTGNGKKLQEILEQKASQEKNWLEKWWLEYAYLRSRQPLIPFSNMAAGMPPLPFWPPSDHEMVYRASLVLRFQLDFWAMLREERMRPMIHKNRPWTMDQFRYLFNTIRIPEFEIDRLEHYFRTRLEGPPVSTEVVVLHRGHLFAIPTIHPGPEEVPYSLTQINELLYAVLNHPLCQHRGSGVAALTSTKRDRWAKNRQRLLKISSKNRTNLERIERSLQYIAFDQQVRPKTPSDLLSVGLCGDPTLRWADKSIGQIYFPNGMSCASADHTPFDGFATALMTHYMITSCNECKGQWPKELISHQNPEYNYTAIEDVSLLSFDLDQELEQEIKLAIDEYNRNCERIEMLTDQFDGYGKRFMKQLRLHPEALVQVALQLAYHRVRKLKLGEMHSAEPTCYCTGSTRMYYNGRTETCRSCTQEATEFSLETVKNRNFGPNHMNLLRKATEKFQQLMSEAMHGQGIDRHFLGLYVAAIENNIEIPEIFLDPTFAASGSGGNYVLSSSCSGYWNITGGVPPMREDGYGVFYGIENDRLHFSLFAYKDNSQTNARLYFNEICNAFNDIEQITQKAKL